MEQILPPGLISLK
ncbi:hypothetical protein F383_07604 [Gossypium arboreum]|uniref:Uncharacterized protein n=1 Tax=Gossypium arboreum TaxID=29729 RepID=A0A0B0P0K2_GOSAR|nr:hypothetical protein F383_07604 [Gossypium arboreum]